MDEANTLGELMAHIRARLAVGGIEDPAAETRILLSGLLELSATELLVGRDRIVDAADEARLHEAVARRLKGEPPYRIIGHRGFYDLDLILNAATLEPRPDTEILVDTVLELVSPRKSAPLLILDLGTGTGAIALALLANLPQARAIGSDLSPQALEAATANARHNHLADRFEGRQSRWFEAISGRFDVLVSNPPYIRSDVIPGLDREVRDHDPVLALDGGQDGLDAYRAIAAGAVSHLVADGIVAVEIGYDQRDTVSDIFEAAGFLRIRAVKDLGGRDRVLAFAPKA